VSGLLKRQLVTLAAAVTVLTGSGLLANANATAATVQAAFGARAGVFNGSWGTAQEVPGTAALNVDGNASVTSMSCASPGDCSAGGWYRDSSGSDQAFVVNEVGGVWGTAEEVPGTAALNVGGSAAVTSVSCASAGNCSAGGQYSAGSGNDEQMFVVNEVNGVWGTAEEIPGSAVLNAYGFSQVSSVSCASAGNCSAGGFYTAAAFETQAFVVSEVNGIWGSAEEVPGSAALNAQGFAGIGSVSCASAGNCSAGGWYTDASINQQALVVSEVSGTWRTAKEVPGTAALNTGGFAQVSSVSCASAGNCTAGGEFNNSSSGYQALVASEVNGTWRTAKDLPGSAALNAGGDAQINSVSCASAGNCVAGGFYAQATSSDRQALVASEVNGVWRNAREVPGSQALNAGADAEITAVSCTSAGNCGAGGYYTVNSFYSGYQALVVSDVNGTWKTAKEAPGTAALNSGSKAEITAVSCAPSAANCDAGGYYADTSGAMQAFVS